VEIKGERITIVVMIIVTMAIITNQNQINQKKVEDWYHLLAELPLIY
jgi:hypothetical protein